jgi:hypothetical protein
MRSIYVEIIEKKKCRYREWKDEGKNGFYIVLMRERLCFDVEFREPQVREKW